MAERKYEFPYRINELELNVEVVIAQGLPSVSSVRLLDGTEWNTDGVYLRVGPRVEQLDDLLHEEAKRRFAASMPARVG